MGLYEKIKKRFPREVRSLNDQERNFIINEKPFLTEDCNLCSYSFPGIYDAQKNTWIPALNKDKSKLCCHKTGNAVAFRNPSSERLTPEQALDYFHNGGNFCSSYTGGVPSEETIKDWITKRDEVVYKVTGLENLEQLFTVLR